MRGFQSQISCFGITPKKDTPSYIWHFQQETLKRVTVFLLHRATVTFKSCRRRQPCCECPHDWRTQSYNNEESRITAPVCDNPHSAWHLSGILVRPWRMFLAKVCSGLLSHWNCRWHLLVGVSCKAYCNLLCMSEEETTNVECSWRLGVIVMKYEEQSRKILNEWP